MFLAFDEPDIVCAIPDEVVRQTLLAFYSGSPKFPGWDSLKEHYRQAPRENFKRFFTGQVGIRFSNAAFGEFLSRALAIRSENDPPDEPRSSLMRAMGELFAETTPQPLA